MDNLEDVVAVQRSYCRCSIPMCTNRGRYSRTGKRIHYFPLPKNSQQLDQWLKATSLNFVSIDEQLVCSEHFSLMNVIKSSICTETKVKLTPGVVPKYFPWLTENRTKEKSEADTEAEENNDTDTTDPVDVDEETGEIKLTNKQEQDEQECKTQYISDDVYGELMVKALSWAVGNLKHQMNDIKLEVEKSDQLLAKAKASIARVGSRDGKR